MIKLIKDIITQILLTIALTASGIIIYDYAVNNTQPTLITVFIILVTLLLARHNDPSNKNNLNYN